MYTISLSVPSRAANLSLTVFTDKLYLPTRAAYQAVKLPKVDIIKLKASNYFLPIDLCKTSAMNFTKNVLVKCITLAGVALPSKY